MFHYSCLYACSNSFSSFNWLCLLCCGLLWTRDVGLGSPSKGVLLCCGPVSFHMEELHLSIFFCLLSLLSVSYPTCSSCFQSFWSTFENTKISVLNNPLHVPFCHLCFHLTYTTLEVCMCWHEVRDEQFVRRIEGINTTMVVLPQQ